MSCSSSSSRHGGGSSEFWREYIGGTSLQLFEVIHQAIQLAKADYPDKFLAERDRIAQNLFSHHLNNSQQQEEEVDEKSNHRRQVIRIRCKLGSDKEKQIAPPVVITIPEQQPAAPRPRPPVQIAKSMHHQPTAPGNKLVGHHDDLLDKKLAATKRKLSEAYERSDMAKRVRRTQLLDFSQAAKLQNKDKAKQCTNKGSRTNNNTWGITRTRRCV